MKMPEERFWEHVHKRGPDECWEWTGNKSHNGYGQLRGRIRNSCIRAHRLSYEMEYGPIPDDLLCLHRCDNPGCVNPKHLFIGTQSDNIDDKLAKGRGATGTRHGRAKLSPSRLKAARLYRMNGWTFRKIAERFNVSPGAIHHAFTGMTWKSAR